MPSNGPSYTGMLPRSDEGAERVINAVAKYIAAQGFGILRVSPYDENGNPAFLGDLALSQRVAYVASGDGVGQPEYIGYAQPGSSDGSTVWSIKKLAYDSSSRVTSIKWADGTNAFTKEWDERATYTYS